MTASPITELSPGAPTRRVGLFGVSRQFMLIVAGVVVLGLTGVRLMAELAMMTAHGNDAQMAIWWVFCFVQVAFWLVTGCVLVLMLYLLWSKRLASVLLLVVLLLWVGVVGWSGWSYAGGAKALADAKNPATSPQRLHQLVDFHGVSAGYQLDNFLAENPNTSQDDLRSLAFRPSQSGTDMLLAGNPNTPVDILEKFFAEKDAYVWNGLARNPKLPESIEKGLAKSSDPDIQYLLAHRGGEKE